MPICKRNASFVRSSSYLQRPSLARSARDTWQASRLSRFTSASYIAYLPLKPFIPLLHRAFRGSARSRGSARHFARVIDRIAAASREEMLITVNTVKIIAHLRYALRVSFAINAFAQIESNQSNDRSLPSRLLFRTRSLLSRFERIFHAILSRTRYSNCRNHRRRQPWP
jgi:hypothetical protein